MINYWLINGGSQRHSSRCRTGKEPPPLYVVYIYISGFLFCLASGPHCSPCITKLNHRSLLGLPRSLKVYYTDKSFKLWIILFDGIVTLNLYCNASGA